MRGLRLVWMVLLAALISAAGGASAWACARPTTPAEQVAAWLATKPIFDAVVDVTVTSYASLRTGGWVAAAERVRVVSGQIDLQAFEFGERELVINSCGDFFEPAEVGDAWRLYLRKRDGRWKVGRFLPVDLVTGGLEREPLLGPVESPVPTGESLEGHWRSGYPFRSEVWLSFSRDTFDGAIGCTGVGGRYVADDGAIRLREGLIIMEAACHREEASGPASAVWDSVVRILEAGAHYRLHGSSLTLTSRSGETATFTRVKKNPRRSASDRQTAIDLHSSPGRRR